MRKEALIPKLCEYFNCSDLNDCQYPKCALWDTSKCEGSKVFNRIEPLLSTKEENQNSAPLLELLQWCEQKMIDCRALADPEDGLSCELAVCQFHDFMSMRDKVASMIRAACPAELVQQPITQQGSEPSEILQHLENAKKLCAEGLSECAISSIDKAAKLLPC